LIDSEILLPLAGKSISHTLQQITCIICNQQKEIDFIILKDKKPWLPIEVKLNDDEPSKNWTYFLKKLSCEHAIQVVMKPGIFKLCYITNKKLLIISADPFLAYLA